MTRPNFIADLNWERISTVIRQNKKGFIYGITYVDHKSKCDFNGSDLGKAFSAKMILERCNNKQNHLSVSLADEKKNSHGGEIILPAPSLFESQQFATALTNALLQPEDITNHLLYPLKKTKRKRKKKATFTIINNSDIYSGEKPNVNQLLAGIDSKIVIV